MKENEEKLLQYLKSQNLMTIATFGKNPWIASVYYVTADQFNLYFLSEPTSIHCQQIIKNTKVACNIADSSQKVIAQKIGVQLEGIAARENKLSTIKWMLRLWNKLNPGFESIINLRNIQLNKIKSRIYKVKPRAIKFFNEKLYGPEGFEIFKF